MFCVTGCVGVTSLVSGATDAVEQAEKRRVLATVRMNDFFIVV